MAWQLGLSFVVWVAFSWSLWRGYYKDRPVRGTRGLRVARALGTMAASVAVLFIGMLQIQGLNGVSEGSLTLLGWFLATLLGTLFVAMQVDATSTLLSLVHEAETLGRPSASDPIEGKKDS